MVRGAGAGSLVLVVEKGSPPLLCEPGVGLEGAEKKSPGRGAEQKAEKKPKRSILVGGRPRSSLDPRSLLSLPLCECPRFVALLCNLFR